jgi:hypothetical protein
LSIRLELADARGAYTRRTSAISVISCSTVAGTVVGRDSAPRARLFSHAATISFDFFSIASCRCAPLILQIASTSAVTSANRRGMVMRTVRLFAPPRAREEAVRDDVVRRRSTRSTEQTMMIRHE